MISFLAIPSLRILRRMRRLASRCGLAVLFCLSIPAAGLAQPAAPASEGAATGQAWSLRCVNVVSPVPPDASQPASTRVACEASQTVSARQGDQDVDILKLAISEVGEEKGKPLWGLVALLPLDVLLTSDFGLAADKLAPGLYRYRNCNHLGCFAVVPLNGKLVAGLRRSPQGTAYFRLINGKVVKVVFPLEGFGGVLDKLTSGKDLPAPSEAAATPETVP